MKSKSPEYITWSKMFQRCYNPKCERFPHYGGKGIKICDRWKFNFDLFLKDMGNKPSKNHSIDRIDNNKDYSPENCRWSTSRQQASNRSTTTFYTYNNKTQCLKDWARELNIHYKTLHNRINIIKMSFIEAISWKGRYNKISEFTEKR